MENVKINFNDPNYKPETLVNLLRWRAETQLHTVAYTYLQDGEKKEKFLNHYF